jgi:hypothetical protein
VYVFAKHLPVRKPTFFKEGVLFQKQNGAALQNTVSFCRFAKTTCGNILDVFAFSESKFSLNNKLML